jgi:hypothetical protein
VVKPSVIEPGSPEPGSHEQVEALLRLVPFVAFEAEIEACLPRVAIEADTADAFEGFVSATRDRLLDALGELGVRAARTANGGLSFLARTLIHFLGREPVADREHPLLVALYLRGVVGVGSEGDHPVTIGRRMNDW